MTTTTITETTDRPARARRRPGRGLERRQAVSVPVGALIVAPTAGGVHPADGEVRWVRDGNAGDAAVGLHLTVGFTSPDGSHQVMRLDVAQMRVIFDPSQVRPHPVLEFAPAGEVSVGAVGAGPGAERRRAQAA